MEDFRIYLDETNPDGTRTRYTRQLSSLSLKDCVSNENLQHAESSASVTIPYDAELFSLLARSKELDAQIINGNDEALFTGTVTVDISWTDNGKNDEIDKFSLTVKDYSSKFSRKTESEILLENTNLAAVAAHFAQMCGVTIAQTLPETPIQVICIEKGKQILASLEAILYQYGFSFYFSPEGIMKFFDWRDVPENPPELPPDKIRTGFSGSKTTKNYTGVSVSFNTLTTKRNELVYFQGNGYDSNDDPAPFYVQPGVYFPYESSPVLEETDGIVHQSFAQSYAEAKKKYNGEYDYQRNKTATLLYSKNHYVEREWDGTITIDRTNFESKQAAVRLRNTGSADAKVYKLGIRADAVYRDAASTVTAGDQDGNVFTTDFEFVYEMATAENIAKALLAYFAKGNLSFRFQSEEKIEPGSFRRIDTGATGLSCTVFIRSRTLEGKDEQYSYEAQSVSDFVIQTEKSSVNYSQTGAAALAAVSNLKQALNEGRGNYVPDKITGVKATAGRDGITITCNQPPKGLKNTISKYIVEISRDQGVSYSSFTALAIPFEYSFIRVQTAANAPFDGYPEASDLQKYRIRIKAENVYGNQSEDWSEPLIPDTAEYGTWLLSAPVISPSVSHRSVLLRFSQPTLSSGRERYGTIRHRVEIRQIDLDAAGDFFKPNETDDPNEAETNYKAKAAEGQNDFVRGYIEVAGDYSQTLPLKGQNEATPAPTFTTYQYRITAVNEKGISESATVNVVARPTSVVDVVRGWEINEQGEKVKVPGALGAENIYAEELSAISVNLGRIKAGILQSDIEAGETKPNVMLDLDGQEFRVGNSPRLEEANNEDAEYLHWIKGKGLFMKMKNFILDSIGSLVKGVMTVISVNDPTRRTVISNTGMKVQKLAADGETWQTSGRMSVDEYGNILMGNGDEDIMPDIISRVPDDAIIYRFNGTKTDQNNLNGANLAIKGDFSADYGDTSDSPIEGAKYLSDYTVFAGQKNEPPYIQRKLSQEEAASVKILWNNMEHGLYTGDRNFNFSLKNRYANNSMYWSCSSGYLFLNEKYSDPGVIIFGNISSSQTLPSISFNANEPHPWNLVFAGDHGSSDYNDFFCLYVVEPPENDNWARMLRASFGYADSDFDLSSVSGPPVFRLDMAIGNTKMTGDKYVLHNFFEYNSPAGDNTSGFLFVQSYQFSYSNRTLWITRLVEFIPKRGSVFVLDSETVRYDFVTNINTFVPSSIPAPIKDVFIEFVKDPNLCNPDNYDDLSDVSFRIYALAGNEVVQFYTRDWGHGGKNSELCLTLSDSLAEKAFSHYFRIFHAQKEDNTYGGFYLYDYDEREIWDTGLFMTQSGILPASVSHTIATVENIEYTDPDTQEPVTAYKPFLQETMRFMCWIRGTVSICGIQLPNPAGDGCWYFLVVSFNADSSCVNFAMYSYTGVKLAENSFTFDAVASPELTGTDLVLSGDIQNLIIDGAQETDAEADPIIKNLVKSHKYAATSHMDGIDVTKKNVVFNAKDPDAVYSNCFYTKNTALLPIGFVYIQFPDQQTPDVLFGGTWQNITSNYPGAFFRAEGGNASAFGAGLQGMMIQSHDHSAFWRYVGGGSTGSWGSGWAVTNGGSPTGGVETRPINYTIRIWKRTA